MSLFKDENRTAIIKRLFILLAIILVIFALINAIWYFGYQQRYNSIAKHLEAAYSLGEDDDDMLRYTKEVGDYTISMKMPEYLGSGGFVSIAKTSGYEVSLDDEENIMESSGMYITLYIWPKYFNDYKIGLDFYDEANSIWEQVELTSDMELMNTDDLDDAYVEYILQLICNGVQREHNKKLNNGLPILHKVPPKRDYGRYFCIMAEKGGTSHGGLTEKLSPFFHAKKQEVNAYGR